MTTVNIPTVPTIPNQIAGGIIGAAWYSTSEELRAIANKRLSPDDFMGVDKLLFGALSKVPFTYLETESMLTEDARRRLGEIQSVLMGKPTTHEFLQWVSTQQRESAIRQLAARLLEAAGECVSGSDPDKIGAKVINAIVDIRERGEDAPVVGAKEAAIEAQKIIADWKAGKKYLDGISTGFANLDRMIGGMKRKHVVTLGARPGMGKTQLALQVAINVARRIKAENRDACIVFFSAEMTKEELVIRLAQCITGISSEWLEERYKHPTKGKPTDSDYDAFNAALEDMKQFDRYFRIDEIGGPPVSHMLEVVAAESATHKDGIDLIVFDYLALSGELAGKNDNETTRIGKIMRGVKRIAKRYNCAFLLLAQLSRAIESRESREPQLSDLMGATDIEALSNHVLFIYRPGYYVKANGDYLNKELADRADGLLKHPFGKSNTAIQVAKVRGRQAGVTAPMWFEADITRFSEPEHNQDNPPTTPAARRVYGQD